MHNRNFSEKDDGVWEMAERQEMREWKLKCNNMAVHLSRMEQWCFAVTATGLVLSVTFLSVSQCSGCAQISSNCQIFQGRLLWNRNAISAWCCSIDITRGVYVCVEACWCCGIKCFCFIQWLSAGLCWDRSAARQSLDRNTGLISGSTDLLPLLKWRVCSGWLRVHFLSLNWILTPLNKSPSLIKSWLIRKV